MSINRVILTGNLTRDAELRSLPSGSFVLAFGIAVNERRPAAGGTGEWEDYANFFDCDLFGARAEKLAQYMTKGKKVGLDGRLHWSSWEKDGIKHSKVNVTVDSIEFLDRKGQNSGDNGGDSATAPSVAAGGDAPEVSIYDGDDIPF